jgi:hypothetical protein
MDFFLKSISIFVGLGTLTSVLGNPIIFKISQRDFSFRQASIGDIGDVKDIDTTLPASASSETPSLSPLQKAFGFCLDALEESFASTSEVSSSLEEITEEEVQKLNLKAIETNLKLFFEEMNKARHTVTFTPLEFLIEDEDIGRLLERLLRVLQTSLPYKSYRLEDNIRLMVHEALQAKMDHENDRIEEELGNKKNKRSEEENFILDTKPFKRKPSSAFLSFSTSP